LHVVALFRVRGWIIDWWIVKAPNCNKQ